MKYKLILILIMILVSCKNGNEIEPDSKEINLTNVYDENPSKVSLSDIASSIEYINLQTIDNAILARVDSKKGNIKFFKNRILIKDNKNILLLFDKKGNFLNKIGSIGKGPSEYLNIDGFTILESEKLIAINSRIEKKIYIYDFKGKYVSNFSTEFQTTNLFSFNGHLISINDFSFRKYSNFNNLSVFSKEGSLKKQLLFKADEKNLDKKLNSRIFWSYKSMNLNTYNLNGKQFFWEQSLYDSKDTIWEINKDFTVKYKNTIYIGGLKPKKELFYQNTRLTLEKSKKLTSINRLIETKDYMFFDLGRLEEGLKIYRDKTNKKNYKLQYKSSSKNRFVFSFFNDIDDGLPFWPDGMVSENKVFKLVYGYEIKEKLKKNIKLNTINQHNKKLLDLVKDSKITDNPILMIVTLK